MSASAKPDWEEALDAWLGKYSESTRKAYGRAAKQAFEFMQVERIEDVTPDKLKAYHAAVDQKSARSTAQRKRRAVRLFLQYCRAQKEREERAMTARTHEMPTPETPTPETLTPETPAPETPIPGPPTRETPTPETPTPGPPTRETLIPKLPTPAAPLEQSSLSWVQKLWAQPWSRTLAMAIIAGALYSGLRFSVRVVTGCQLRNDLGVFLAVLFGISIASVFYLERHIEAIGATDKEFDLKEFALLFLGEESVVPFVVFIYYRATAKR
jgi:hypothetical protein